MNRLRAISPAVIGCNFDPSHMFWQGDDQWRPSARSATDLPRARGLQLDAANITVNGVLDAKPYAELQRSWVFRTVGYGNGAVWKAMVSTLRLVG
jgi:sugar phosphate isomerase/epimerase